jgi:DNA-binding response OmpR family regulator
MLKGDVDRPLHFGRYTLNVREYRLCRDDQPVSLSPRPFDLLVALVARAGRLVTREELLREVWKDTVVEQSSLNAAMSVLRQALGDDAAALIETVPGRGYRFIGQVAAEEAGPAPAAPVVRAPGATAVRAVIVDDHAIVRLGVRALLDRNPGFTVVAEGATVAEATEVIASHLPDLLVLDLMLNGDISLGYIAAWRASAPGLRVIVLSMHNEDEFARQALTAGAHGYVMKEQMLGELTSAIGEVMGGGVWVSSRIGRDIVRDVVQGRPLSS